MFKAIMGRLGYVPASELENWGRASCMVIEISERIIDSLHCTVRDAEERGRENRALYDDLHRKHAFCVESSGYGIAAMQSEIGRLESELADSSEKLRSARETLVGVAAGLK
jgi:uncharacterized small protein (DUF1192 family)